jgi:hypothetical protein
MFAPFVLTPLAPLVASEITPVVIAKVASLYMPVITVIIAIARLRYRWGQNSQTTR